MIQSDIIFREIATADALIPFLQLRYRLFRGSDDPYLNLVVPENPEALDLDRYDRQAWHLGLFRRDGHGEEAVGYSRFILETDTPMGAQLAGLAGRYPRSARVLETAPAAPWLALEKVAGLEAPVRQYAAEARRLGCRHVVEVSRTCIDDAARSYPLTRWLYRCLMVFGLVHQGTGAAFTASPPGVGAVNRRFGLRHRLDFEWAGMPMGLYTVTRFDLPQGPDSWVEPMAEAYARQGYLRFEE